MDVTREDWWGEEGRKKSQVVKGFWCMEIEGVKLGGVMVLGLFFM